MAGYTSRILLTLTVPSVFGFLSILWFLKKKRAQTKPSIATLEVESINYSNHYHYRGPMKLKDQEANSNNAAIQSDMQLKEIEASTEKQTQNCNGTAHPIAKIKERINKSKLNGNGSTCPAKEPLINGCAKDSDFCLSDSSEDEITNGVHTLSLGNEIIVKDECTVQVIKQHCPDMAARNGIHNVVFVADDLELPELISSEKHCVSSQVSPETHPEVAKEQCDNDGQHLPVDSSCSTVDSDCMTGESDLTELTNDSSIEEVQPDSSIEEVQPDSSIEEEVQPDSSIEEEVQPDSNQNLPDDGEAEGRSESPSASKYCDSVGSIDSGRGASELQFGIENHLYYMVYEFEIHPGNCGRLIGKNGRHVNYIKKLTNANILIKRHPYHTDQRLCSVTGSETEINAALKLIRKRFPIEEFPTVTLAQINSLPFELQCPETLKLPLPDGVPFEGMLCATVNSGHFFLQQPTHPTFHSLLNLTSNMTAFYSQVEAPTIENLAKGNVCAASLQSGWFRAEVDEVFEDSEECKLKFLDYGGYAIVPRSSIRQIKYDYMLVPFQATECYLGSVMPIDEHGWSKEATAAFEELAQGQILQGCIVGYAENRVPFIHLYKITGATSVFINQELVRSGLAKWAIVSSQ